MVAAAFWVPLALAAAPDVAAAVPLALAVLEAAVPLADLESDLESGFVVLDAASDVFVGDTLEAVEDVSAYNVSSDPGATARKKHQSSYHSLNRLASLESSPLNLCMLGAMARPR